MKDRVKRARDYLGAEGLGPLLVRSVAGTGAVRMAAMVASFAVGVQLARGLGVHGYGYYGIALSVITTAGLPAMMGLPTLVTREVAAGAARGDSGYLLGAIRWGAKTVARLSLGIAGVIAIGAIVAHLLMPSPLTVALLIGAAAIPLMAEARVSGAALQGLQYITRGQIPANLLAPVAMSLLLVGFEASGATLRPASAMAMYSVTAGLAWMVAHRWLKPRLPSGTPRIEMGQGRRWVWSMIPLGLSDGLFALLGQISMLLLGVFASASDAGLFRISAATATVLSAPQAIMLAVSLPLISRLHAQQDRDRLQKLLTRSAQAQLAGVVLLAIPLVVAPGPILGAVFGRDFAAAADALRLMLLAQFINAAFGLTAQTLNMTHHERRVTRALMIAVALNVVAVVVLVPILGLIGGALAYLLSMAAWNVIAWWDSRTLVGVDTSFLPLRVAQPRSVQPGV